MRVVTRIFRGMIFASTISIVSSITPGFMLPSACQAADPAVPQGNGYYTSFSDSNGYSPVQSGQQTPSSMLEQARSLEAKENYKSAYELAQRAWTKGEHDAKFSISYIVALVEMAQNEDNPFAKKMLNEAINASNVLHKSKLCNGQNDAELSYHFMVAVGSLADQVVKRNEKIAGQLYAAQGKIAEKLQHNPGFPRQSLEYLGEPLMNLAKSHAIRKDEVSALETLRDAFEIGFTDFDGVVADPAFEVIDETELKKVVRAHRVTYRRKVAAWTRDELANFSPFPFSFDVANVDGGRVSSSDLKGKVTVVELWATWCAPCREGIPNFVKLHDELGSDSVSVVGISMDEPSDPASAIDTVKNFGIDNGIEYTLAVGTDAVKSQIPGEVLLPTTLFVDHKGNVRYVARGYHDYAQLESLTKSLIAEMKGVSDKTASR